ncbi:hypothetical protein [Pedobacter nutrimenti]|uniref:hypothetical protein n=1 Tax=Pedobacter nutrimenti TaxID=1241337 RepID=UPI00292F3ED6|nr:hypothetical protein [Pedobacter nutrimenti]
MRGEEPMIDILGTKFVVDVMRMLLYQQRSPLNVIYFSNMENMGTHYRFEYDTDRKAMPLELQQDRENVKVVKIPPLNVLDPEGMSLKYGVPLNEVMQRDDLSFLIGAEDYIWLRQLLGGTLPTIDLAGDRFEIDLEGNRLLVAETRAGSTSLNLLERDVTGFYLLGYYHKTGKQLVKIPEDCSLLPVEVLPIKIPYAMNLDSVGASRKEYKTDLGFLKYYSISPKHQTAEILSAPQMKNMLAISRKMTKVARDLNIKYGFEKPAKRHGKRLK